MDLRGVENERNFHKANSLTSNEKIILLKFSFATIPAQLRFCARTVEIVFRYMRVRIFLIIKKEFFWCVKFVLFSIYKVHQRAIKVMWHALNQSWMDFFNYPWLIEWICGKLIKIRSIPSWNCMMSDVKELLGFFPWVMKNG